MKKTILALAVAAASLASVAQADNTTLYGSIRMAVQYNDDGSDNSVAIDDVTSRWGIKGSDDLGNGLKAVYRFEWGVNTMGDDLNGDGEGLRTRLAYVGLAGGFGEVQLGHVWSPYYDVMGYNDLFNDAFYSQYQGVFRLNNAVKYITPDMGGFQLKAALIANGKNPADDTDDEGLDAYNISAAYNNNGIFAGLTYYATNRDNNAPDTKVLGGVVGYSNDMFQIGLVAERTDNGGDAKPVHLNLAGQYNITDMDIIRAGVSMVDADVEGVDDAYEAALGYQHNFSKRTRVWAEYSYMGDGHIFDGDNLINIDDAQNKVSLGIRTDF